MNNLASYFTNFTILIKRVLYVIVSLFPRITESCQEVVKVHTLEATPFLLLAWMTHTKNRETYFLLLALWEKQLLQRRALQQMSKLPCCLLADSLLLSRFFLALGDTLEKSSVLTFLSALTKLWVIVLSMFPVRAEHFMATFYSAATTIQTG